MEAGHGTIQLLGPVYLAVQSLSPQECDGSPGPRRAQPLCRGLQRVSRYGIVAEALDGIDRKRVPQG